MEPSVRCLGLRQEVQVPAAEGDEFLGWRRLPAHHHEAAGAVVDAVTVLMPGHDPLSVLEKPDVIGQPLQMPERRGRVAHAAAPAGVRVSAEASSR
jgi:hypothetical protein